MHAMVKTAASNKWRKVNVTTPQGKVVEVTVPSREDIESLQVGDIAPYCFGNARVTRIYARGICQANNRAYVLYYVEQGPNSQMSAEATEGQMEDHAGWYVGMHSASIQNMQGQADAILLLRSVVESARLRSGTAVQS